MQLFESKSVEERVILVGIQDSREDEVKSLRELEELVDTAGAVTVGKVIQKRESIHPASYVGPGKLEELRELLYTLDATGIVCDDELSPAQYAVLEEELECKVMDRTLVILDIFAGRAATKEGKLQVELAQLKYRAARLVGLRRSLSRLGGGIGTRGPGEKKLEVDRRVIHGRISQLKRELEEVHRHQELLRGRRIKGNQRVAAIVGYTNAGKSTLLNALTGSQVMEEAKLVATLDPTTRVLELPGGQQMLLTDTVGFIRKLPHHLVEAFKSTLEEARYADVIIHVVDGSNPQMDEQMDVVYETLRQLGVEGKKMITLFNKQDQVDCPEVLRDERADVIIRTSAKTGLGLDKLKEELAHILQEEQIYIERTYGYDRAGAISLIRTRGQILEEEYLPEGIAVKAYVPVEIFGKV